MEDKSQCERCWGRDNGWKKDSRAGDRKAALSKLARTGTPECVGWPRGSCGTKKNLQIDHIHNDGHLDLRPSGRRRGGVQRVLADPTPWTWAQILCGPCNLRKARDVKKAGLKPMTKDDVERIRKQGRKKQSPKTSHITAVPRP